ncbi:hypothetical protein JVU11DRAFT_1047 [Chiua virens]|nr:hypothetical protein JVU11DRAFT_1047 [Chiua virens]
MEKVGLEAKIVSFYDKDQNSSVFIRIFTPIFQRSRPSSDKRVANLEKALQQLRKECTDTQHTAALAKNNLNELTTSIRAHIRAQEMVSGGPRIHFKLHHFDRFSVIHH